LELLGITEVRLNCLPVVRIAPTTHTTLPAHVELGHVIHLLHLHSKLTARNTHSLGVVLLKHLLELLWHRSKLTLS
jgi:hypothetical protein